jgi:hypothetical protein
MEKAKIIEALKVYFQNKLTDYAVMITGDWGVGKTYFLKNEGFSIIKQIKLRPIYVSLIGLNDISHLEKLIFQKINPFYNSQNKSTAAREADYIESIINDSEKPDIIIPDNLVLCFDDLERINPEFLESAMGFVNVFIEHFKTKCIFLSNERLLENIKCFPTYKTIKEKYIRFTYSFTPELTEVLKAKVSDIKTKHQSYYDNSIVVEMFKRGESYNLRTLFFTLSIFEQCLLEFDKLQDTIPHKNRIIKFVLTYVCFYTIEYKKGTPNEILDKITIARKQKILLPNLEDFIGNDEVIEDKKQKDELSSIDESARLEIIQQSYFIDDSIDFERFVSIAELIKSGYLNAGMLEKEIIKLSEALVNREQSKNEVQLVQLLDNVFKYSDSELQQNIELLVNEVKKGSLNLVGYLKLYQNLVWLESLRIKGVNVKNEVTQCFREGVEKAFKTGRLEYIHNLKFQIQWSNDDKSEYAKKYSQFADFVNSINEGLSDKKVFYDVKKVLTAIAENNDSELFNLLTTETTIRLNKLNAKEIYEVLNTARASTTNEFINALQGRYANDGSFISQMPKIEKDFILTLFALLFENKNLNLETEKSLNEVALMFLKSHLEKLIKYHFPENNR